MQKLINTLPAILAATGDSAEVAEAACISAWKVATGDTLNRHALAVQFTEQILVVLVEDAIWQRQMEQMRGQLVGRMNSLLGQPLVRSIEFRIDANRFLAEGDEDRELSRGSAPIPVELLSAAAKIEDAGLRRAFLGAASSCLHRIESA